MKSSNPYQIPQAQPYEENSYSAPADYPRMKLYTVQKIEAILASLALSALMLMLFLLLYPAREAYLTNNLLRLYKTYGSIALTLDVLETSLYCSLLFLFLGGILFKRNHGRIAFFCLLPIICIPLVALDDLGPKYVQSTLMTSALSMAACILAGKAGGMFFSSFPSPLASLNWSGKKLGFLHDTPGYYIVVTDVLITLYALSLIYAVFSYFGKGPQSFYLFMFLSCAISLTGLILLRLENPKGLYLYASMHGLQLIALAIKFAVLSAEGTWTSDIAVKHSVSLLPLLPVLLICYKNRKRLYASSTWR